MYPIPPSEILVQTKTCRHCQTSFPITDKDLEFYEKVSPVFSKSPSIPLNKGEATKEQGDSIKYLIPTPTLCPDCRQQRRLSFRNERKLYKRNCDATGKSIISIYSPDKPFKVYHQDYWWSDKWDPMEYGRDFDFNRGFFEQFGELMREVPLVSIYWPFSENSDYTNYASYNKDCYLIFNSGHNENCFYAKGMMKSRHLMDSFFCSGCEIGYENSNVHDSFSIFYCHDCRNCRHSFLLIDCEDCEYCFDCTNLHNAKFCIQNRQYTPEEYRKKISDLPFTHSSNRKIIRKNFEQIGSDNCIGDLMSHSKNCFGEQMIHCEDCKYCSSIKEGKSSMDTIGNNINSELLYESIATGKGHRNAFNISSEWAQWCFYTTYISSCQNCFWCIGLRNKSYCILNKQYTKEEYEALVPRIIEHMMSTGEWGEFFPSSLSPFGYNETVAMEYYPLTREEVLKSPLEKGGSRSETEAGRLVVEVKNWEERGLIWSNPPNPLSQGGIDGTFIHWPIFNWSDYEPPFPKVEKIIPTDKLPDDISKIPDDILNWAIECEVTKKPFRIIKQELEFYRKHNLPIPKRHPDQRHLDRMALRNPRKLFERKCDKCGVEMVTTYAPERKEIVYCEGCYNAEVL